MEGVVDGEPFTIEADEEEPEKDEALDDLVTEVQDAFFEGRYRAAITMARGVLASHPREEDTYDMLLASLLALGEYAEVVSASASWVAVCGESLKQLLHCLEAAYMLGDVDLVEDMAHKLCFLFESSAHDSVFVMGALLAAALATDFELPFPDCLNAADLLAGDVLQEPVAWWLSAKLGRPYDYKIASADEQARDLYHCLRALDIATGEEDKAVLLQTPATDATGLVARHLICGAELRPNVPLSRVHPLFRKRLAEKREENK